MVKVIKDDKITEKNDISPEDFRRIAEFISDTKSKRKRLRKNREQLWKEVDRQLRMEPHVPYKRGPGGKAFDRKKWMPELEIPGQSQALEILVADADRMMFPDNGPFFLTNADIGQQQSPEIGVLIQDSINEFVQSFIQNSIQKFNFRKAWTLINTEAMKYGTGVARPRFVTATRKFPALTPVSIKNTYLDDMETALLAEGVHIQPSVIFQRHVKLADLKIQAEEGVKDKDEPDGGWMPGALSGLESDKNGFVETLEYEGDLVVPMSQSRTEVIENVIATAVIGKKGQKVDHQLVRLRFRDTEGPITINVPYQLEDISSPYGTSPLMKGVPLQKAASEALNRTMQAAILSTEPVLNVPKDDAFFAGDDFVVEPGAQWKASKPVETLTIGKPADLFAVYADLNRQYADVTGINAPRLGQQTKSHTTAFAKDQEIERGQVRTVDYVRSALHGPVREWIKTHYFMAREVLDEERIWLTKTGTFETVTKDALPENVRFEIFGAAGPQESLARQQQKREAITTLIQVNQLGVQQGQSQPLNYRAIERFLLQEAGISESEVFTGNTTVSPGGQQSPGVDEAVGGGGQGAAGQGSSAALQALAFGGRQ